jgi:hypothetical protein
MPAHESFGDKALAPAGRDRRRDDDSVRPGEVANPPALDDGSAERGAALLPSQRPKP